MEDVMNRGGTVRAVCSAVSSGGLVLLLGTAIGCFEEPTPTGAEDATCVCGWEVLTDVQENGPPIDSEKGTARDYDLELTNLVVDDTTVDASTPVTVRWTVTYSAIPCEPSREFGLSGPFIQRVSLTRAGSTDSLPLTSFERELVGGESLDETFVIEPGTLQAMPEPIEYTVAVEIEPAGESPLENFPLMQCVNQGDAIVYNVATNNDSATTSFTVSSP